MKKFLKAIECCQGAVISSKCVQGSLYNTYLIEITCIEICLYIIRLRLGHATTPEYIYIELVLETIPSVDVIRALGGTLTMAFLCAGCLGGK